MPEPERKWEVEIPPPAYSGVAFSIDARERELFNTLTTSDIRIVARRLLLRWIYATPAERDAILSEPPTTKGEISYVKSNPF